MSDIELAEDSGVLSSLDAELSACSTWMPNVDRLDFVNDPTKNGPNQHQTSYQLRERNIGLYALKPNLKNHIFLGTWKHSLWNLKCFGINGGYWGGRWHERLSSPRTAQDKSIEGGWMVSQQGKSSIHGTVMNTGMLALFSCCLWVKLTIRQKSTSSANTQRIQLSLLYMSQHWWSIFCITSHVVAWLSCWQACKASWWAKCPSSRWQRKSWKIHSGFLHCTALSLSPTLMSVAPLAVIYIQIQLEQPKRGRCLHCPVSFSIVCKMSMRMFH